MPLKREAAESDLDCQQADLTGAHKSKQQRTATHPQTTNAAAATAATAAPASAQTAAALPRTSLQHQRRVQCNLLRRTMNSNEPLPQACAAVMALLVEDAARPQPLIDLSYKFDVSYVPAAALVQALHQWLR
jgi:hypothetical protein